MDSGSGSGAGEGAVTVEDGAATVEGYFQGGSQLPTGAGNRSREGGKISGCTIGAYYRRLGVPPCSDVENGELTQARTAENGELSMDLDLLIEVIKQDLVIETMVELVMESRGGGAAGYIGGNAASNNGGGGGASWIFKWKARNNFDTRRGVTSGNWIFLN